MSFFNRPLHVRLETLQKELAASKEREAVLLETLKQSRKERVALMMSLIMVSKQYADVEKGRDVIQAWGTATLEELRALRRLEEKVRTYVKEVVAKLPESERKVFIPMLDLSLRELDKIRKEKQ